MLLIDFQMIAIMSLIVFFTIISYMFMKETFYSMIAMALLALGVWGEDLCSRADRLMFYTTHFDSGTEMVCHDHHAKPQLISRERGWERKGEYLFKANQSLTLLEDTCEIINLEEPRCVSMKNQTIIAVVAFIGVFGWIFLAFRRLSQPISKPKESEERKENYSKAAEAMAPLYESDPELKEGNAFVGDHFEVTEQEITTKGDHHV